MFCFRLDIHGRMPNNTSMALTTRRIGLCKPRGRKSSRDDQNVGFGTTTTDRLPSFVEAVGDTDDSTSRVSSQGQILCDSSSSKLFEGTEGLKYRRTNAQTMKIGGKLLTTSASYANIDHEIYIRDKENEMRTWKTIGNDGYVNSNSVAFNGTENNSKESQLRRRTESFRQNLGELAFRNEVFIEGFFLLVFVIAVVYIYFIESSLS